MLISILAAIALQTSPMAPAHCMLNDGPVVVCQVMVQRREEYVGVGFSMPGGNLIFGSRYVNDRQSSVELLSAGESTLRTTGVCVFKTEERIVGCIANVNGEDVSVVAHLD